MMRIPQSGTFISVMSNCAGAEGEIEDIQLSLFNSLGQRVFSLYHLQNQSEIQVPNQLSPGVHILRISSEGYVSEQKLIKTD